MSTRNLGQYALIHQSDPDYGRTSETMVDQMTTVCRQIRPATILDFGCGRSKAVDLLAQRLGATPYRYDPAIAEFSAIPASACDLVLNTDVLEHLDVNEVGIILQQIATISGNVYFNISTRPANKVLPNGENAHATVMPKEWWRERLMQSFPIVTVLPSRSDEATFVTWSV